MLTSDQLKANATAMKTQGATDDQVQSYLDGFKGQGPAAPVPQSVNNPDAGIINNLMKGNVGGAAYQAGKDVTQAVDKPFLSFAALIPQTWNALTNNQQAVQTGQAEGYDFGDFFGKAKPLLSGFDATKGVTDSNMRAIADSAGLALEAGSWLVGGGEGKTVEAGVDAVKGMLSKTASKVGDLFTKTPIRQFSTAQGAAQGLESYGQGQTPGQALQTGTIAGLTSAAGMKVLDKVGGMLASGPFFKGALQTQAGQFFSKKLGEIGKTIEDAVTNASKTKVASAFKDTYNTVQQETNNALSGFLSGIKRTISAPSKDQWIPSMINQIGTKMNATRNEIQQGFDKVFGSNTMIGAAKATKDAYDSAIKQINDLASGTNFPKVDDPETRAGMVGPSLAPNLYSYLNTIKDRILDPIQKGTGFNMKELNNLMHFVPVNGTPAEQGIAKSIQTALYKDIEGSLKNEMGTTGKALATKWDTFKEAYRKYGNTMESKFVSVWDKMNTPENLANSFLKGTILTDADQTKELQSLIGVDGIASLRATIMHTALGNAITAFDKEVQVGVPASYDAARKAASAELQKFIDVTEQAGLKGFEPLSAQQTKWIKDAQTLIQNTDAAKIAGELNTTAEKIQTQSDQLARGREVFEAAKTPAKFAESISKMTSLQDVQAAMSFLKNDADKAFVGVNIVKDMFTKFTSAISKGAKPEDWAKVMEGISNIGGADKKEVFTELFGKSEATDTLVKSLDTATKALQAIDESPKASVLKSAGHATAAFILAMMHHPIIATGEASRAIKGLGMKEAAQFEEYFGKSESDLYAQMEKNGEITVSGIQSAMRKFGRFLKSTYSQFTAGQSAADATGDTMNPAPTNNE